MVDHMPPSSDVPGHVSTIVHRRSASFSSWDIQVVFLSGGLLVLLLSFETSHPLPGVLRVVLGLFHTLLVPGYCLVAALFPRRDDIDLITRVTFAVSTSAIALVLLALLLDNLVWGLSFRPMLHALLGWSVGFSIIAMWRRWRLAYQDKAYRPPSMGIRRWWGTLPARRKTRMVIGGVLFVGAVGLCGGMLIRSSQMTPITEFAILSTEGTVQGYPREASLNDDLQVMAEIRNREGRPHTYWIEVRVSEVWDPGHVASVTRTPPFEVVPGETHTLPIVWRMPWAGEEQKVTFLLFMAGKETSPYRELYLFLDRVQDSAADE